MRFFKRGEKELQMIFGLFILLIISLVVLSLFFKFTEKSSGQLEGASSEYFTKAQKEKAIQECQVMCDTVKDDNTLIEFCAKTQQIDWDGDKTVGNKIRWGKWEFCEERIPCFVLVDNCQNSLYDANRCKTILSDPNYNSLDIYQSLANGPAEDTCQLCSTGADMDDADGDGLYCDTTCNANWRCKYGFFDQ